MRVKLLSGNQAGQIVDAVDAPILLSNGLAELAPEGSVVSILDRDGATLAVADPIAAADTDGGSLVDVEDDDAIAEQPSPEDAVPARVRRRQATPKADPSASRRKRR